MPITHQFKNHTRAILILELIQEADSKINAIKYNLKLFLATKNPFDIIRLINKEADYHTSIKRFEDIKTRLLLWYFTCVESIANDGFEQCELLIKELTIIDSNHKAAIIGFHRSGSTISQICAMTGIEGLKIHDIIYNYKLSLLTEQIF